MSPKPTLERTGRISSHTCASARRTSPAMTAASAKFGYGGDDCSEAAIIRKRRSITTFTPDERQEYLSAIINAKDEPYSRYWAIRSEVPLEVVQVTLYDLFVWLHYYAGRENDELGSRNTTAQDFAHESGGFPTWHRLYLLWFENEIRIQSGLENFTLPYWDWTVAEDRDSLFNDDWYGGMGPAGDGLITGYFGSNETWGIICLNANSTNLCDPTDRSGLLRRCPFPTDCNRDNKRWPTRVEIDEAVSIESYDATPYSRFSPSGFRNYMEGFGLNNCSDNDNILCTGGIRLRLHNTVHIILGIGDFSNLPDLNNIGTMGHVPTASNDPIFVNHHAMVDLVLELWLSERPDSTYLPSNDEPAKYQGHRLDDCLVPFIPLYSNADMFNPASDFGYEYEYLIPGDDGAIPSGPTGTIVLVAAALGAYSLAV